MENQEKRKQIEAALGQFFLRYRYAFLVKVWDRIITHLAEEVIAIGVEVKHIKKSGEDTVKYTGIYGFPTGMPGTHGTPGKALAIIIPLEEAKDGD